MAMNDILPYRSAHGGHEVVESYEILTAGFFAGEPVGLDNSSGAILECPADGTNPALAELLGIAMAPVGYTKNGTAVTTNWRTGVNFAAGDTVPVIIPTETTLFVTRNFTTAAGSGFNNAAPTQEIIGNAAGLVWISGSWGIEVGTLDVATCRIVDVLDDMRRSIQGTSKVLTTSDTYYVVFKIVGHINNNAAAPTPVPA